MMIFDHPRLAQLRPAAGYGAMSLALLGHSSNGRRGGQQVVAPPAPSLKG